MVQPAVRYSVGAQLDPALVPRSLIPYPLQSDFCVLIALQARELLSPLDQENAVLGDQVIEAEGLKMARWHYPIDFNVIDTYYQPEIIMLLSKRSALYAFGCDINGTHQKAFDKGGRAVYQFTA